MRWCRAAATWRTVHDAFLTEIQPTHQACARPEEEFLLTCIKAGQDQRCDCVTYIPETKEQALIVIVSVVNELVPMGSMETMK